jgi:hypothetical protein
LALKSEVFARELRAIVKRGGGFGSETEAVLNLIAETMEASPNKAAEVLVAKMKPRAKKAAASKSTTFDVPAEGVVATFLERLRMAKSIDDVSAVLAELSKSGRKAPATIVQVKEIAGRYLGAKVKFASKAEALTAVKDRADRKDWDRGVLQSIAERAKV